jgi:hypothetical protein
MSLARQTMGRRLGWPSAIACCLWCALPARVSAQQPAAGGVKSLIIDACTVAPTAQLRFVVAAGLGHSFPLRQTREGHHLTLSDPQVTKATCPVLQLEMDVQVTEEQAGDEPPGIARGSVRVKATLLADVVYRDTSGASMPTTAGLTDATLCVRRIDDAELDRVAAAPAWLTKAWIRDWLRDAVASRACFDITSLVYVALQRGGRLVPMR